MAPRLHMWDVRKSFGGTPAVRNFSLDIAAGEFVSLLGPSGCGKSTTLAMIAGFLDPDGGVIDVDGRSVLGLPPEKRRIGLVFQDYAVFSRLSVRSNLLFGLEAQGVARAVRSERVARIARQLDLEPLLDRRGGSLNMSEMQRLALGRALVTEPSLLLLDEPMSNLDAALRAALRSELRRIQRQLGQSVLYVTHDQVEAMAMSDRIAVMRDGEIQQIASPEIIYHAPATRFVAEFIGDPPINVVDCEIMRTGTGLAARTGALGDVDLGPGDLPAGRYLLAFRPHDVKLRRDDAARRGAVRLVEHFGSEDVAHLEFGEDLVTVVVPHSELALGDTAGLEIAGRRAMLIDAASDRVVPLRAEAMVA